MPNINKVVFGNQTLIDLSTTTLSSASQLENGVTAYDRAGNVITGTASGGGSGSVTQDQDGYIVIPPDGGGSSGTGTVVIEDTTDTAGGTIRTITAVDISDTTAVAADVASGKYFYTSSGVKTLGTKVTSDPGEIILKLFAISPSSMVETFDIYNETITSLYGNYTFSGSNIRSISLPNLTSLLWSAATYNPSGTFSYCSNLISASFPNLRVGSPTSLGFYNCPSQMFNSCTSLAYADDNTIGGGNKGLGASAFASCSSLEAVDFTNIANIATYVFKLCSSLVTIVFRGSTVANLSNINVFDSSPFASDGTGGTLYVPNDLISSYQSATNWSTILGYTNNQIKSIESTHTDPNAPVDLTLYRANGTLIPTS